MYVPRHGDIVWIDFEPHAGHEQAKERPALVLSGFTNRCYPRKNLVALQMSL